MLTSRSIAILKLNLQSPILWAKAFVRRAVRLTAVALGLFALIGSSLADDKSKRLAAEGLFKKATDLMQREHYTEAIPYLKQVERDFPENPAVLWNLGIALVGTGDHLKAAETWRNLRKVSPDDWRARSKLVQAYQALGDRNARDTEIKSLYEHRENSSDPKVKNDERFCREQAVMAGQTVYAFEYFSRKVLGKSILCFPS